MKAMILAAGKGTRMQPLTDDCPKPLLKAGGKPLIEYHLMALAMAGVGEVVINTAHFGERLEQALGDGSHWGLSIGYSREGEPLETGGAITRALPLLGHEPFLLVNGDVFCDLDFASLLKKSPEVAHVVLVPNPGFKSQGDFGLQDGWLTEPPSPPYTYAGIGVYNAAYFQTFKVGERFALGPILRKEAAQKKVSAQLHEGVWMDIGTPQRLQELDQFLRAKDQTGELKN